MLDLKQKFEEAKTKYEAARTNLEKRRDTYDNGPQKEYAETEANLSELQGLITQDEAALENSKTSLGLELQASNGRTTDAAKNLLRERRDMEELLEQRRLVLQEVQKRLERLRGPASEAAENYRTAYHQAAESWWQLQMYSFLAEHGQRLCELMAIQHSDTSPRRYAQDEFRDETLPAAMLLRVVKSMVAGYTGDRMPYRSEIGKFDMKGFPSSKMLTPVQRHKLSVLNQQN
jgi:chromosome segregation ATPase